MSASEYAAVDAVTILNELARIVRASSHSIAPETNNRLARELEHVAAATARDAQLTEVTVTAGRAYGGGEWMKSLIVALFPAGEDELILRRITGNPRIP